MEYLCFYFVCSIKVFLHLWYLQVLNSLSKMSEFYFSCCIKIWKQCDEYSSVQLFSSSLLATKFYGCFYMVLAICWRKRYARVTHQINFFSVSPSLLLWRVYLFPFVFVWLGFFVCFNIYQVKINFIIFVKMVICICLYRVDFLDAWLGRKFGKVVKLTLMRVFLGHKDNMSGKR